MTCISVSIYITYTQMLKFMWPTWGPPGSCRPQVGPTLAPRTLLSGMYTWFTFIFCYPHSSALLQMHRETAPIPVKQFWNKSHELPGADDITGINNTQQNHVRVLLIVAGWRHMTKGIWVNVSLGNGSLSDDTKPLPEPMLSNYRRDLMAPRGQWSRYIYLV